MSIDIICPLYNAEMFIESLQKKIEYQSYYEKIRNIRYIVTKGNDLTEEIIKKFYSDKVSYKIIESKDFSHSLTREKAVRESSADVIVFISQDIKIQNEYWLEELVRPIEINEVDATYSRQICKDRNSIEFYTRQKNYPDESKIKTKNDIQKLGINTFFYSDASSAIKRNVFLKLNGYDNKKLPTNEDMYIAYKLIMNDYKIKYCSKSIVEHSHNFTYREIYKRYKSYGMFLKQEAQINLKINSSGGSLAKFIIKQAIRDKNIVVILKFLPDMMCRYIGMKVGKNG